MRRIQGLIVGVIVGALLAGCYAYAVTSVPPNATDKYSACVSAAGVVRPDSVRLNSPATTCPQQTDTIRSWNAQGPAGPAGAAGSDALAATTARLPLHWEGFGSCANTTDWVTNAPVAVVCGQPSSSAAFGLPLKFSDYPSAASARFTGVMEMQSGGDSQGCVRIYDLDANAEVPGTTVCLDFPAHPAAPSHQPFDTGPVVLPAALHHYVVQSQVTYGPELGWGGRLFDTALVVDW